MIITSDGSHSLYVPALHEHYHSLHGAIQEAEYIFIAHGLAACRQKTIRLLELGFGTGLNAFLTLLYAQKHGLTVHYEALEKYPLSKDEASCLNYAHLLAPDSKLLFEALHSANWGESVPITTDFQLLKQKKDLKTMQWDDHCYNLVYFDAFGPDVQPDLWELSVFQRLYNCMSSQGCLLTYSAKGTVRRNMKAAGFQVEKLPGPVGKRHITRARKP